MLGGVNQLLVLCLRLSYGFLYSGEKKTAVIMSLLLPTLIHILIVLQHWILTLYLAWKSRQSQMASVTSEVMENRST